MKKIYLFLWREAETNKKKLFNLKLTGRFLLALGRNQVVTLAGKIFFINMMQIIILLLWHLKFSGKDLRLK